jgi:outer membrane lipoprotein-sorting protein
MKYSVLVSLVFAPFILLAQQPGYTKVENAAEIQKKISSKAQTIHTIESNFVQEKNISVLSEKIISKGHLTYKEPSKLRWEYTTPFNYLVILNQGKLFLKDENKSNKVDMQSNKMFQEINNLIVSSVQGNVSDLKNFKVIVFQNHDTYLFEMTPVSGTAKDFFSNIHIYFSKSDLGVQKINMLEDGGDYTLISFTKNDYNVEVSDEKFSFK